MVGSSYGYSASPCLGRRADHRGLERKDLMHGSLADRAGMLFALLYPPSGPVGRREALQSDTIPALPGFYAWWFNAIPPLVPTEGCTRLGDLTLLYVGISPQGTSSRQNLRKRIRYHYRGNAYGSTLRLTLGVLLEPLSGFSLRRVGSGTRMTLTHMGEQWLDAWMDANAFVSFVPCDRPWEVEPILLQQLVCPLNIDDNDNPLFRDKLKALRRQAKAQAREMPIANESNQRRRA